jgi:methylase of polypeptide subunit release factors
MPRLSPFLLRLAKSYSPFLTALLRECRDLPSSANELRWLTEHAISQARKLRGNPQSLHLRCRTTITTATAKHESRHVQGWRTLLRSYVKRRARGEPLQYILGTQPFGELEILCKPGVLVPRWETEVYTSEIGGLVKEFLHSTWNEQQRDLGRGRRGRPLSILDLCTGTGCIPLSLYEILSRLERGQQHGDDGGRSKLELKVLGVDISTTALDLARENLRHNISLGQLPDEAANAIGFLPADVLKHSSSSSDQSQRFAPYVLDALQAHGDNKGKSEIDILTANPPYISPTHFSSGRTTRSVRRYEPRLALVPAPSLSDPFQRGLSTADVPTRGDEFYHDILPLSRQLSAGLTVLEVGDTEQAVRVVELAAKVLVAEQGLERKKETGTVLETWYDDGRVEVWGRERSFGLDAAEEDNTSARAVVIWRREWAVWRRERPRGERECS